MTHRVFLVAAERSGDGLGAGLIQYLRRYDPKIKISGIGGAAMAQEGVSSDFDIAPLSILGFTEGLKAYPTVLKKVAEARDMILDDNPDAVILIDSWGFMVRVAKALKKAGYQGQVIKYVAPQVWAMRPKRAKVLSKWVDYLLSIQRQDAPYFLEHGLPVTFVGNPMFDEDLTGGDGVAFRRSNGIEDDAPLVAVLFGSRPTEIDRLFEPMTGAIDYIRQNVPGVRFAAPISHSISDKIMPLINSDPRLADLISVDEKYKADVFAASDVALACSGTITTQLAASGVPTVVTYQLSPVTYFVASRLFKPDHISLVNMSANEALMPEFMQKDSNAVTLGNAVVSLLNDPDRRQRLSTRLKDEVAHMRGEGGVAAERAATEVLRLLDAA